MKITFTIDITSNEEGAKVSVQQVQVPPPIPKSPDPILLQYYLFRRYL